MARARLREIYDNELVAKMIEKFRYKNPIQALRFDKIMINMGVGEARKNARILETVTRDLEVVAGQKAMIMKSKKPVTNFKIHEDMSIGYRVTLRGERTYEFADRLISLALPHVRNFRGVSPNSLDGGGNYTMDIREQLIFPEIEYDKTSKVRGMDIIFVTTAQTDEEVRYLLTLFDTPSTK